MTFLRPAVLLAAAFTVLLSGCDKQRDEFFNGYAEADYIRLASPIGGTLARLHVRRGDHVAAGAPAFELEQESERAARDEAAFRVQHAEAQLANLTKGRRPDEIAALEAQLAQARAAQRLSSADLARQTKLVADKFISPARLDEARAAVERDRAKVNELQAQLRVARLGARPDEIEAAQRDVKAAQAQLAQADWKLQQKSLRIPIAAEAVDVLFREGEWVPPGAPVVSLLAPQHLKARFFVPQEALGRLRLGQQVALSCDGCGAPIPATVSFIAREAEYTAPLIYSRENRSTLVFMIEARPAPADALRLHPGQPIEVRLAQATPRSAS